MHSDMTGRARSPTIGGPGRQDVIGGSFAGSFPSSASPGSMPSSSAIRSSVPPGLRGFLRRIAQAEIRLPAVRPGIGERTPRFDLFPGSKHYALCFEATRGCRFPAISACLPSGHASRDPAVQSVLRDIVAGQRMLAGTMPAPSRRIVGFCDNNIGGDLPYLRALCEALGPLRIQWYGAATFNVSPTGTSSG